MSPSPTTPAREGGIRAALPRRFAHLDLLRLLSRGERGEVYVALRPEGVDRLRCIKILPGSAEANPGLVGALRSEAAHLVRRIHGNVVQIDDVGQANDHLFFVTELVDGRDLGTVLEALGRDRMALSPDLAVFVALELAAAASYLRRPGPRGADEPADAPLGLSPHAVLLSVDGDVKLAHYGVTMSSALAPRPGHPMPPERVSLLAPELIGRSGGSAPGDVYAIGALLWEMLTGRPLSSGNSVSHLAAVADGSFRAPSLTQAGVGIPADLDRLVLACLVPSPADRPRDCDQLRAAIVPFLRTLGGGGPQRLAGVVRQLFGRALTEERAELTELVRRADADRGGRSGPSLTPAPVTLTELARVGKRQQIATPLMGDLAPGQVIPGTRYRALSKIGEGGMGIVYAAEHVDLERKVALKVLPAEMSRSPDILQQFRQEARAASKIGNPFICDVTDFGEVIDGRVFFVMEYIEGRSLGALLRSDGRLEPGRAIAILRQVSKALGAAHEKGIVHLDVKPDNVMLAARGGRWDAVKVVDFGIAGFLDRATSETIAGTPEYIAPERAFGRGYDHRSDVYSLGAMAYEMLTGRLPFHGTDVVATLTMHTKDPPEPFRRRAPDAKVPGALEAVVMKMLAKEPAERQQNMAALEAELCEAQIEARLRTAWDDLELPAVEPARQQKLRDGMPSAGAGRRKVAAYVAALVALVGAGVGAYATLARDPEVVETTRLEELSEVAELLKRAEEAARGRRYTTPAGDSALDHIVAAEAAASKRKVTSPGAARLRQLYATALEAIGDELMKANLLELAIPKWREALLFRSEDPELERKAGLSLEEKKVAARESHTAPAALPRAERPSGPAAEAKDAAARLYVAAREGRFSEARLAAASLAQSDVGSAYAARLADGLRRLAVGPWMAGRAEEARPYYDLVARLDPHDLEAAVRARPGSQPVPPAPAPTLAPPAASPGPGVAKGRRREVAMLDEPSEAPRDQAASQKSAVQGHAALKRGRIAEAETAFAAAIRADPLNGAAVGGLAEAAFERARYSDAMDYARRASRLAPKSPRHLVVMGDAYFKLLRYGEALVAYQKAQALAPEDAALKARIARVNEKLGRR